MPLWTASPKVNVAPAPGPSQITLGDFARKVREQRAARRRVREVLAEPERTIPVVAAAPSVSAPAPRPQREPAVAAVPHRRVLRPVARRVPVRRSAPRVVNIVTASADVLTVDRGDSLWTIAQREFGDGRMWVSLWQANPPSRSRKAMSSKGHAHAVPNVKRYLDLLKQLTFLRLWLKSSHHLPRACRGSV